MVEKKNINAIVAILDVKGEFCMETAMIRNCGRLTGLLIFASGDLSISNAVRASIVSLRAGQSSCGTAS